MEYAAEDRILSCTGFSLAKLNEAMERRTILQSTALLYDTDKNLHFTIGGFPALMPHKECADGLESGAVRDIAVITRVGRPTCFVITGIGPGPTLTLSRAKAQQRCKKEYLNRLRPGDIIRCTATHIESFGVFCDVGCGISALLPIDCLSCFPDLLAG